MQHLLRGRSCFRARGWHGLGREVFQTDFQRQVFQFARNHLSDSVEPGEVGGMLCEARGDVRFALRPGSVRALEQRVEMKAVGEYFLFGGERGHWPVLWSGQGLRTMIENSYSG